MYTPIKFHAAWIMFLPDWPDSHHVGLLLGHNTSSKPAGNYEDKDAHQMWITAVLG